MLKYKNTISIAILSILIGIFFGFYNKQLWKETIMECKNRSDHEWEYKACLETYTAGRSFFDLLFYNYNWQSMILFTFISFIGLILLKIYVIKSNIKIKDVFSKIEK